MHQATADVKCQLKGQTGAKEETDKRTNSGVYILLCYQSEERK